MSTIAPDRPHTAPTPPPPDRAATGSGLIAGWRLALRMGWREIKRARWRNLLVILLVGAPVALVVAGLTLYQTSVVSPVESIPTRLGSAQAEISLPAPGRIIQTADLSNWGETSTPATKWPASGNLSDPKVVAAGLSTLVPGARVLPLGGSTVRLKVSGHWEYQLGMYVDAQVATDPALRGKLDLVSGRWPTGPDEVAVSDVMADRGELPTTGTIEVREQTGLSTKTIVGIARAYQPIGPAAVILPMSRDALPQPLQTGLPGDDGLHFLLASSNPVTWDQVRSLNQHGVAVFSRSVVESPPPGSMDELPVDDNVRWSSSGSDDSTTVTAMATLLLAGLLLETTLLAGPAFAISAARQRHALALAASNGATTSHLRRLVLGQALILGAITAALGVAAGLLLAAVGRWANNRWGDVWTGPYDVPVGWVLGILVGATLACVVAALIPSRGLARLDVVGALRGSVRSGRVHRGLPFLGAVLFGLGALGTVLTFAATAQVRYNNDTTWLLVAIVSSGVLLVVGAVCLIPLALVWVGALTRRLPAPMRMATRDATRQRGRAVPTVASILGGAALLAGATIPIASQDAYERATYAPQAAMGWGVLYPGGGPDGTPSLDKAIKLLAEESPSLRTVVVNEVAQDMTSQDNPAMLSVQRTDCTAGAQCSNDSMGLPVLVVDAAAQTGLGLPPEARAALDRGSLIIPDFSIEESREVPAIRTGDQVTLAWRRADSGAVDTAKPSTNLTAYVVPASRRSGRPTLISAATAARLKARTQPSFALVQDPSGPISQERAGAIQQRLDDDESGYLSVERGYQGPPGLLFLGLFGLIGGLIVLAAVVATALSLNEARRDLTTLASIGARPASRRAFAATQAGFLALIGMVLGYFVGAVPGIVGERSALIGAGYPVVIPWWWLLGALAATVLLAAAIGALLVRRNPSLVRRDR